MFVFRYDMRCPEWSPASPGELYATALEQAAFVDGHGLGPIALSEHHVSPDGYLPSPVVLAAGIAGVSTSVHITISALLVNLYDPVRLAEDIAVLDLLSGGRISLVLGLGYREEEYDLHGVPWAARGQRLDDAIAVLLRAWSGESFEWQGRRVEVRPLPLQKPHPLLLMGGSSAAAARRAARFELGFLPTMGDDDLSDAYLAECERLGHAPGIVVSPSGPAVVHVAEDPDRAWAEVGRHLLHDAQTYAAWQPPGQRTHVTRHQADSVEELRAAGDYLIVTPDECAALVGIHGSLVLHPLIGGMPPEQSWESLRLVADKVQPMIVVGSDPEGLWS